MVGHFLHDLNFANIYIACSTCFCFNVYNNGEEQGLSSSVADTHQCDQLLLVDHGHLTISCILDHQFPQSMLLPNINTPFISLEDFRIKAVISGAAS